MDDDDSRLEEILDDEKAIRQLGLDEKTDPELKAETPSADDDNQQAVPDNSTSADTQQSTVQRDGRVLNEDIEEAIQYSKRYLEDLLSFFGLNTDVHATTEDKEVIELDIPSTHLNGFLIGHNGDTVRALQYTISNALKAQNYSHTRVNVDVAEYKKQKAQRLAGVAEDWFKEVRDSGKPKELQPMNAADRRVVHQAATDFGLLTESVGFGRDRHIVLKPGEAAKAETPPPSEE